LNKNYYINELTKKVEELEKRMAKLEAAIKEIK
jgi:polyhydroxyalkanoate synthesis regulator phasin